MKLRVILIWFGVATAVVGSVISIVISAPARTDQILFSIIPTVFAIAGALIASRQPGNIIGWLMMTIGVGTVVTGATGEFLLRSDGPPDLPIGLVAFLLWLTGLSWLFLIYPIFHMLLVFPNGKLLSPRWRVLVVLEVAMIGVFMLATALSRTLGPVDPGSDEYVWTISNPIGVILEDVVEGLFESVWSLGLVTLALGGLLCMILRFRRAKTQERQQLKFLLYSFGVFAVVYAVTASTSGELIVAGGLIDILFGLSILAIPVSMAAAILRYRLFDIDLLIRKTLLYVVVTGLLGVVYVGSVFLIRSLLGNFAHSSLSVAASTLLVAALFNPIRRRLQKLIDRRLFRTRYDAEQVLDRFASFFRLQTDLGSVSDTLLGAVQETMHPTSLGLWLRGQ